MCISFIYIDFIYVFVITIFIIVGKFAFLPNIRRRRCWVINFKINISFQKIDLHRLTKKSKILFFQLAHLG